MKLWATNEVRAKSKFWYFLRKLKKVKKSNGQNEDMADAQSEEDDSNYDNNADKSGDDTPFHNESGDEEPHFADESENEQPDLTREHDATTEHAPYMQALHTVRPKVYESRVPFHSRENPYLDHLPSMPDVDALIRDIDDIDTTMWDEPRPTNLYKNMFFGDMSRLSRAVRISSIKICRDIEFAESSKQIYKVVYRRWDQGCKWMLRARKLKTNMWIVGKYISKHTCDMDTFNWNHFNLNVGLISLVLISHIEVSIRYKVK
nr:uncharacterized protein LOC104092488 [Nicotiana tomentosiformis]